MLHETIRNDGFSTTQQIVKTLQRGVALKIVLVNRPVSITFMYIFLTLMSNKSNWPKFFNTVIQVWLLCKTCESVLHRTNTSFVLLTSLYKPGANLYKEFICFHQVTLKSRRVAKYEYIKENEPEESVHEVTIMRGKLYRCDRHSYMYQQRKWITGPRSFSEYPFIIFSIISN